MATFSFKGKVALVTGAARGIGLETAREMHRRGAAVVIVDLSHDAIERAAAEIGERATPVAADVTDATEMAAAVQTAVDTYGGLDAVAAVAGVGPPAATMLTVDPEMWERTVEIDLNGVWRTVQPALEQIAAREGQVAVVSSVYAFVNGMIASPYAVSKAGVEALGRALRTELSVHGAGSTVAHFGFVDTRMVQQGFDEDPGGSESLDALPAFIKRRLTPAEAATELVDGMERRAARVIAPSFWRVPYFLRGLVFPALDFLYTRDKRIAKAVRRVEQRDRAGDRMTTAAE